MLLLSVIDAEVLPAAVVAWDRVECCPALALQSSLPPSS
jgi:hypothetical protein